ncbi:helix-turn-helix domain-containing protein [Lysobacter maris]|uniref:Helix-turn-helix domain-containing protein n=1 Tax=Marilutibacter maris TaxID=1605891 RepID=A0A508A933_9GAMM|nr:helix-turn-helix domain-containing protein [Lysobacter maris]
MFAARLLQARQLRGLSQRALGDRMGLGKEKGSSRINRYEHQVTAIGFDNLEKLAAVLDVPVAYLLADNAAMADAILELSKASQRQQASLALAIKGMTATPALAKALIRVLQLPKPEQDRIIQAVLGLLPDPTGKGEDT